MAPIPSMGSMEEYVKLLLSRYVRPHFNAGAIEVHVVFDVAGLQESPKEIEQQRRDSGIYSFDPTQRSPTIEKTYRRM